MVHPLAQLVAARQMADEQTDVDGFAPTLSLEECLEVARGDTEAVDAGLDVEGRSEPRAAIPTVVGPFLHLVGLGEDRHEAGEFIESRLAFQEAAENVDGYARKDRADGGALVGKGDEEIPAAGLMKSLSGRREAGAVCVRLDRRAGARLAGLRRQEPVVRLEGIEVDRKNGARPPRGRIQLNCSGR